MGISVTCPQCGKSIKAPDSAAGTKGRCPQCKTIIQLPAAPDEPDDSYDLAPDVAPPALPKTRATPTPATPPPLSAPPQLSYAKPTTRASAAMSSPGWKTVRAGLSAIYFGIVAGGLMLLLQLQGLRCDACGHRWRKKSQ